MKKLHKTSASRWWSARSSRRWTFLANPILLFGFIWCQEIIRSWKLKLSRKIWTLFSTRFSNLWLVLSNIRLQADFCFCKDSSHRSYEEDGGLPGFWLGQSIKNRWHWRGMTITKGILIFEQFDFISMSRYKFPCGSSTYPLQRMNGRIFTK